MNELIYNLLIQTLAYFLVCVGVVALLNLLTNGYLFTYIRVKSSRGKLVLVRIRGTVARYYRTGKISEKCLHFKDRQGLKWTLRIYPQQVVREMAVSCVDVDEETAAILMPDLRGVSGFDAVVFDGLIKRAMQNKSLTPDVKEIIIIILGVLNLAATVFVIVAVRKIAATLAGLNVIGVVK